MTPYSFDLSLVSPFRGPPEIIARNRPAFTSEFLSTNFTDVFGVISEHSMTSSDSAIPLYGTTASFNVYGSNSKPSPFVNLGFDVTYSGLTPVRFFLLHRINEIAARVERKAKMKKVPNPDWALSSSDDSLMSSSVMQLFSSSTRGREVRSYGSESQANSMASSYPSLSSSASISKRPSLDVLSDFPSKSKSAVTERLSVVVAWKFVREFVAVMV